MVGAEELSLELGNDELDDGGYDDLNRKAKAKESVKGVKTGVKDVGSAARTGPKAFTKSLVKNSAGLTKGVTKGVAKGAGKSVVAGAKAGGQGAIKAGRIANHGTATPRIKAEEGELMSGYIWKQIGHGVVQVMTSSSNLISSHLVSSRLSSAHLI